MPLPRSVTGTLPNAIDLDSLEYMTDALDQCISHMLCIPTAMQTFIRIRLYRKNYLILLDQKSPPHRLQLSMISVVAGPVGFRVHDLY